MDLDYWVNPLKALIQLTVDDGINSSGGHLILRSVYFIILSKYNDLRLIGSTWAILNGLLLLYRWLHYLDIIWLFFFMSYYYVNLPKEIENIDRRRKVRMEARNGVGSLVAEMIVLAIYAEKQSLCLPISPLIKQSVPKNQSTITFLVIWH